MNNLSFTKQVKAELCLIEPKNLSEIKYEFLGFFWLSGVLFLKNKSLEISHKNNLIIKRMQTFFEQAFSNKNTNYKILKKKSHFVTLVINEIDEFINFVKKHDNLSTISPKYLKYIARGFFLYSGYINTPHTTFYHLEIVFKKDIIASLFLEKIQNFFQAKKIIRQSLSIVYIKKAELISNFLNLIGAHNSLLTFENVRIERDFLNSINRLHNMDIANLEKTIQASGTIIYAIKVIQKETNWVGFDKKIINICDIRTTHPNFTLQEICDHYNKNNDDQITKSGVNHIFRKIKNHFLKIKNHQKKK